MWRRHIFAGWGEVGSWFWGEGDVFGGWVWLGAAREGDVEDYTYIYLETGRCDGRETDGTASSLLKTMALLDAVPIGLKQ